MASVVAEISYLAGFLDGDGCFRTCQTRPNVTATQKTLEPLDRLQRRFGGSICQVTRHGYYQWVASGMEAVACAMTVYTLMTPRRQGAIREMLDLWKEKPITRGYTMSSHGICPRGGASHTIKHRPSGRAYCVECNGKLSRESRARKQKEKSNG
jgi:hypothetical protein